MRPKPRPRVIVERLFDRAVRTSVLSACILALAGCAVRPPPYVPPPAPGRVWRGPPTPQTPLQPQVSEQDREPSPSFAKLTGWEQDDHKAALEGLSAGCKIARVPDLAAVCKRLAQQPPQDAASARRFFETQFQVVAIETPGLLTGYFSPEYDARFESDLEFTAPLRAKPADLIVAPLGKTDAIAVGRVVDGQMVPYPDRTEIELQGLGQPLLWLRPEDLFFLQIQGSGTAILPGGERKKLVYEASNGRTFSGLAKIMRERGLLADAATSADAIRQWLVAHKGPEAAALMQTNPRYVFFTLAVDDGQQPIGAAGVPLPPGRSIAVDPSVTPMGGLYWIDAQAPVLSDAFATYRRTVVALDTGGAIKGPARADLYLGKGPAAGIEAGRIRHTLRLYRLQPLPDATASTDSASLLPTPSLQNLAP